MMKGIKIMFSVMMIGPEYINAELSITIIRNVLFYTLSQLNSVSLNVSVWRWQTSIKWLKSSTD